MLTKALLKNARCLVDDSSAIRVMLNHNAFHLANSCNERMSPRRLPRPVAHCLLAMRLNGKWR